MDSVKQTAVEILKQLGGNRFIMMTGAKNFGYTGNRMSFKICRNANKVTHVRITLTEMDLYKMEFLKCSTRTGEISTVSELDGIYNDMLESVFTDQTGLNTRL